MKNLPDWLQTAIALLALFGGLAGLYASNQSEVAEVRVVQAEHERRLLDSEDYDAYLQGQHDDLKERVIIAESQVRASSEDMEDLKEVVREVIKELRKLNEKIIVVEVKGG